MKMQSHGLLSSSDDDGDDNGELRVNEAYATRYNDWRQKEERQKLKDRYGEAAVLKAETTGSADSDDSDSDSTSTEDELAEQWTNTIDKEFLTTLAALKSKDPKIYSADKRFFDVGSKPSASDKGARKKEKSQPMYLKDYERKLILERGGKLSDTDDSDDDPDVRERKRSSSPSYAERLRHIKDSFKSALTEDDGDELLTKRTKSAKELEKEEEDYLEWLRGKEQANLNEADKERLKPLRQLWEDPNIAEDERFLRDFILNKEHDDGVQKEQRIPTYTEIVQDLDDDAALVDKQDDFERKYNFRYEEPDQEFIKSYPRTMKDSIRRTEDKRKEQRLNYKERKKQEKKEKHDELRQLRRQKQKEIGEKVRKLKMVSGNDGLTIDVDELEKDFDPDDYDKNMQKYFNDDYYAAGTADEEKPIFSDSDEEEFDEKRKTTEKIVDKDSDLEGVWDTWVVNDKQQGTTQEQPSTSSARQKSDEKLQRLLQTQDGDVKKSKKNSQLAQALLRDKPLFDPTAKTFEQYCDEYYNLHYEDIIGGDTPCRFRYRGVRANDFGLGVGEVLAADDKELNQWVSLKKMAQYRTDKEEDFDVRAYKRKAENVLKKQRTLKSVYKSVDVADEEETADLPAAAASPPAADTEPALSSKRKRRRKKKHTRPPSAIAAADAVVAQPESQPQADVTMPTESTTIKATSQPKRRKRTAGKSVAGQTKRPKPAAPTAVDAISDERLKAYGISNPKKFRNKIKYRQKGGGTAAS